MMKKAIMMSKAQKPQLGKTDVRRSPSQQLVDLCKSNKVAFLENGDYLDEDSETVIKYLFQNNIDCTAICKVEEQGLESVLRQCRDKDIIVFQTTWTYPVSQELKKAFMSIQNPEFKKTFIEIFVSEPTFLRVPKGVIHDIYALNVYMLDVSEWEFEKLPNFDV